MRTIYKYPIQIDDKIEVMMPAKAQFNHIELQYRKACMWFEVDTEQPLQTYFFSLVGTGNPIPDNYTFCGSFIDEPFVWHLYGLRPKEK